MFILCYLYCLVKIVRIVLVFCCIWFSLVLRCECDSSSPVVGASVIIWMSLSIPFPFWVAAEQKGGQGSGQYIASLPSLGKRITLHPCFFVSDIAIFVLERDVQLQPTNRVRRRCGLLSNYLAHLLTQASESCIQGVMSLTSRVGRWITWAPIRLQLVGIHGNGEACRTEEQSSKSREGPGSCLEGKRENYQVCSVQYFVQQLYTVQCTHIWTD